MPQRTPLYPARAVPAGTHGSGHCSWPRTRPTRPPSCGGPARRSPAAGTAQLLREARQHLELAEQQGVPDADKPRLKYRLAKTWLQMGVDLPQVIAALTAAADRADDPVEAYGLLADAYAKQTPPDLPAALEAVKQQVAKAPPDADPAVLARARLRLGELHV